MRFTRTLFTLGLAAGAAWGQEALAPALVARFMHIISSADGGDGRVACAPGEVAQELAKAGIKVDPAAGFAWATTSAEAAAYQKQGKVVVVPSRELLHEGGHLALIAQGAKPVVVISPAGRMKPQVPTSVKKIAQSI